MALREEKEFAIRAKQKNSVREEANVVSDTSHDREKPTPKTAPSSEQPTPRGRSASRKRNLRGRSPSGKFKRQPCRDFLKGTCTKLPCEYWHPPE